MLRAIGASAVNQAVKAQIIARGYAATRGRDIAFVPGFADVTGDDGPISAVTFTVVFIS